MKTRRLNILAAVCVFAMPAHSQTFSEKEFQDIIRNYMDAEQRTGHGTWPDSGSDRRFDGGKLVPLLVPYLTDSNWNVRCVAVMRLAQYGKGVSRTVQFLARALDDDDWNVRRAACRGLRSLGVRELLPHKDELIPCLLKFARRVDDGYAITAVKMIVDLEGMAAIPDIKHLRRRLATPGYAYEVSKETDKELLTSIDDGCRSVLAKLGDQDAVKEIIGLLRSENVQERVRGIEHAEYVGRQMGAELSPLLNDKHEGYRTRGSDSWVLRVCDVALVALVKLYNLKPSFEVYVLNLCGQFSDAQIAEVKKLVEVEISKTR